MIRRYDLVAVAAFAAAVFIGFTPSPAAAAELDANQKGVLESLAKYTTQIETNIKLAYDAAGPGEGQPSAAKAKLARIRLEQPKGMMPQVRQHMAKLPADQGEVAALAKRLDAADASIASLEARLDGKTAPPPPAAGDKPAPANPGDKPAPPPPADGGMKLDYKQEEQLKNARFYVNEIEGRRNALAEFVKKIDAAEDKTTLDHREVFAAVNTIGVIRQRQKYIADALAKVPADGRGVAPVAEQRDKIVAEVDALEQKITPVNAMMVKLIDPATYPTVDADLKRMRELSGMYANPQVLREDSQRSADLLAQSGAAWAEFVKYAKTYAAFVGQKTELGKQVEGAGNGFHENYRAFAAAAKQRLTELPGEIDGHIAEADKWAAEAIAQQKPAYFQGGIPQALGYADDKLVLLRSLNADAADAAGAKLATTRKGMRQKEDSLRDAIITANRLPPDAYQKPDRADVEARAIAAVKERWPNAKVLTVRIGSEDWAREKILRASSGQWNLIDRSKLQAQVIIQHDANLAVQQPVNLWIDHVSNDKRTAFLFFDAGEQPPPRYFYLLKNVK